ncbi:UNVERIFIED_CONTAM: hypothetical protein O8I53_11265 [Campylobacter lari]
MMKPIELDLSDALNIEVLKKYENKVENIVKNLDSIKLKEKEYLD